MADASYKDILVSGDALLPAKRRRRQTRKSLKGGDNSGALMQLANQSAPANIPDPNAQAMARDAASATARAMQQLGPDAIQRGGSANGATVQISAGRAPSLPGNVVNSAVSGVPVEQPAPFAGGAVVLAAPKRKMRIALKAPRGGSHAAAASHVQSAGTRKAPRKIHLRARGVTARLAKAKKAAKQAAGAPIAEIKTKLESAGIIKKGSKAPDAMLRNMYADLLITKKGL